LTYGRPELAHLDGVARNANPETWLAELVDLAVLAERAFVEDCSTRVANARFATPAAELGVVSAKL
jgi:hypothetical protein